MDFKDLILQISGRIEKLKDNLPTEEATKNALIMPFIQALGYDVFNPLEVLPEMTCDIGTKKGEKIDYAILKDGQPIILMECKHWQQDLNLHDNQLLRYFNVSNAKFGILTNGIVYRFYTDLAEPNKMDNKPFLEVNLLDIKDNQIEELKKFHKSYFDIDIILSSANELKYTGELRAVILNEFANPSPDFVKYFGKQVYDGMFTQSILDQFTDLVKRSINSCINDLISDRLKAAIKEDNSEIPKDTQQSNQEENQDDDYLNRDSRIVTTEIELNGFYIVKSIIRTIIPVERIIYKDSIDYFAINIDNTWKNICRLYFNNENNLRIAFRDENKKEERYKLNSLDDIYNFSDKLVEKAKLYVE
ncbi:MAG: restriction endonuclease [Bacteroidales bacterium]|nr:restriction endonuclease [Bacteroidales bacterium]